MRLYSLLVFYGVLCFSSLQAIPTAYAQDQTGDGGLNKIKALLFRPAGWEVNYIGPSGTGLSEFIYEARGEKVVVKIQNLYRSYGGSLLNCEREVTISSDTIKHDGCRDAGITLRFDPNDQDYPIKAKSSGNFEYKFKAK
jgi:hypothetical protein